MPNSHLSIGSQWLAYATRLLLSACLLMAFNPSAGVNEFVIPNYKQTWGNIRKLADAPEGTKHLTFKSFDYTA